MNAQRDGMNMHGNSGCVCFIVCIWHVVVDS